MRAAVRFTMGRAAKAVFRHTNRRAYTSEDESVDDGGRQGSVHVFVVDDDGDPVTGEDVAAHFSHARPPDTVSHQYTDAKGHAEFSREHRAEPLHVEIFVRGQSFGPYTVEEGAGYTVAISRE